MAIGDKWDHWNRTFSEPNNHWNRTFSEPNKTLTIDPSSTFDLADMPFSIDSDSVSLQLANLRADLDRLAQSMDIMLGEMQKICIEMRYWKKRAELTELYAKSGCCHNV